MRYFTIIFFFVLSLQYAQINQYNWRVESSSLTPINTPFEVSSISNLNFETNDQINYYLLCDNTIDLSAVRCVCANHEKELSFKESRFLNYIGKAYLVELKKKDFTDQNIIMQMLFTLKSRSETTAEIGFGIEEIKDGEVVKRLSTFDYDFGEGNIPITEVTTYHSAEGVGKALRIGNDGFLKISVKDKAVYGDFLLEFWQQTNEVASEDIFIVNSSSRDTLLKIVTDKFQYFHCEDCLDNPFVIRKFCGNNSWNHFAIYREKGSGDISVFLNRELLCKGNFNIPGAEIEVLVNHATMNIDRFKLWSMAGNPAKILKNNNYSSFKADSAYQVVSLDFNDGNNPNETEFPEGITIETKSIEFVPSSFPLFTRRTELTVLAFQNFYSLEWINPEPEGLEFFELERSYTGTEFSVIYSVAAEDDPEKVYYYSDPINSENEVIYYRVKQVDENGEELYSSTIKIGQGIQEYFDLVQNYPNPFNPNTTISVEIIRSADYQIMVYDIVGNKVKEIHEGRLERGLHKFEFDGANLTSGIYFLEVKSPFQSRVIKMILAK